LGAINSTHFFALDNAVFLSITFLFSVPRLSSLPGVSQWQRGTNKNLFWGKSRNLNKCKSTHSPIQTRTVIVLQNGDSNLPIEDPIVPNVNKPLLGSLALRDKQAKD